MHPTSARTIAAGVSGGQMRSVNFMGSKLTASGARSSRVVRADQGFVSWGGASTAASPRGEDASYRPEETAAKPASRQNDGMLTMI